MMGRVLFGLTAAGLALSATPAMAYGGAGAEAGPSGDSYSRTVSASEYRSELAGGPAESANSQYSHAASGPAPFLPGSYRAASGAVPQAACPQVGGDRVVRCVFRPIYEEIRINSGDFDGGVGVIPSGGGGGGWGGTAVIISGGDGFGGFGGGLSAGARGSAFASASASASASVHVSGGFRGGGGGGGYKGGCRGCGGGKH